MNPQVVILIAELLLKYGPGVAKAFVDLFQKPNPTPADWATIWALCDKSYDDYVKKNTQVA